MKSRRFVYIWQFTIEEQHKTDFLAAYNPTGSWAQLFQRDEGYLGTDLLVDDSDPNRFVTVDYWTSKATRDNFRNHYRSEFDELDKRCEEFTSSEVFIGDFVETSGIDA